MAPHGVHLLAEPQQPDAPVAVSPLAHSMPASRNLFTLSSFA